jgi:phosphatidylserine decarboxylase
MIAKEGIREIGLATLALGALGALFYWVFWPLAVVPAVVWLWVVAFFRDPPRRRKFGPGELCSPADGTVTEITDLEHHEALGGPATRIGIFLSLFNVHIKRSPCAGIVRSLYYCAGEFLDARHPESGKRNECNTVLIDPDPPMPGPVEVRQVAGLVARRIICHAKANQHLSAGQRFGMIKFGSRTELIVPRTGGTQIKVKIGQAVRAGITVLIHQAVSVSGETAPEMSGPKRIGRKGEIVGAGADKS